MIEHIVFFHRRPEATPELEQELLAALWSLKGQIPGIHEVSAGATITPERGQGYAVALRVRLADEAALRAYGPHPSHQALLPLANRYADNILVMDYVVPD